MQLIDFFSEKWQVCREYFSHKLQKVWGIVFTRYSHSTSFYLSEGLLYELCLTLTEKSEPNIDFKTLWGLRLPLFYH